MTSINNVFINSSGYFSILSCNRSELRGKTHHCAHAGVTVNYDQVHMWLCECVCVYAVAIFVITKLKNSAVSMAIAC